MKITDLLTFDSIDLNGNVSNKEEAIDHLVSLMVNSGNIIDKETYLKSIWQREELGSTGVGEGVAIPHGRCNAVIKPALAAMVVKEGVDFNSLDGKPAYLFFMIAAPENGDQAHLEVLAGLSKMLMDHDFKERLINARDKNEFVTLLAHQEKETENEDNHEEHFDVLAVTACPTGIAHTYMAAKSLEDKARELNISLKVETNGASGIKNQLTDEEIKNAKGIIVAADKQVAMDRFAGKSVVITKVAMGIEEPEKLLEAALNSQAPIYQKGQKNHDSLLRQIYMQIAYAINQIIPIMVGAGTLISIPVLLQQYQLFNITSIFDHSYLMNSYLAGNLIATLIVILFASYLGQAIAKQPGFALGLAGGIGMILNSIYLNNANAPGLLGGIIAGLLGGYLAKIMAKLMTKLPEDLASLHTTVIYPIFGMLITLAISYILSSYIGFVNQIIAVYISNLSIVGSLILGIVVAGMMAFDMGGPINKIAYIFGISQILEGNYDVMAAVMAGGMVPPLVIAIATTFFKHKFTNIQRKLGRKNYLQGLMFVSEGTLPFVKENRRLVTGVCMIASAMAGGFSMIYNCGISLPHGGIFVLPLVIHPIRYVVALLAGSLCGGMLYGIFKERESVN